MWNLLSGLNLHKLEPVTNSEVTGLTCLRDDKLLAVGWSQRIVQYDIAAAKVKVRVLENDGDQQRLNYSWPFASFLACLTSVAPGCGHKCDLSILLFLQSTCTWIHKVKYLKDERETD